MLNDPIIEPNEPESTFLVSPEIGKSAVFKKFLAIDSK